MKEKRKVIFYKDYFESFITKQSLKVKKKVFWIIEAIRILDPIPTKYFKHLVGTDGIYELRVPIFDRNIRIFCFFDKGNLIIIGNAFNKKSQKTPKGELEKAIKIRKEYFNEKHDNT